MAAESKDGEPSTRANYTNKSLDDGLVGKYMRVGKDPAASEMLPQQSAHYTSRDCLRESVGWAVVNGIVNK